LYAVTPAARISWAAGQFQTFRYIGATLAAAVLGSVFRNGATTAGLRESALGLAVVATALVVASLLTRRGASPQAAPIPG
ncbi:MAG TPA: hypothetical protein VKE27_05200, partial [Candidatus Dormibacteraeota bacterium]|nr:hypothetical protein [Candidatus Dormibacteraeota bacterium]